MQVHTCWTRELTLPKTLQLLTSLALPHLEQGGTVGAHLADLVRSSKWADVVNFDLDHTADWDTFQLMSCRQGLGFFQKLEDLDIGLDKASVAKRTFLASEVDCRATNAYFRTAVSVSSKVPSVARLIEIARRKIRFVLGVCPKADKLRMHFGPGATTAIKRKAAVPEAKFASGYQCSSSMLASGRLGEYVREAPHWLNSQSCGSHLEFVDDGSCYICDVVDVAVTPGKLVCVPKSAKTYRTILVEPNLNGFVQQGIRHAMENALRRAGLSTDDQTQNHRLARRGSLSNDLATIDLSSASDLISYELVKALLPADWFDLLCSARTGAAEVDGCVVPLEKFSSMGNAYTFPLETLIFWAVSTSAPIARDSAPFRAEDVAVYGDDIIVPSSGYAHVVWALSVCGFKINTKKSFSTGPFRESCGRDYYRGVDVRPYYQKHLVSGRTLYLLHNFYFRQMNFDMADRVLQMLPDADKAPRGPDGYGDGHLLSDSWPRLRKQKWLDKGFSGVSFETYVLGSCRRIARYAGDYVSPIYSVYVSGRVRMHESVPVDEAPAAIRFAKDGRPYWVSPGSDGYKKVSIYTLSSV